MNSLSANKLSFITLLLLFSTLGFAQPQRNNWLFANYGALDFNSGSPVTFDAYESIATQEGSASISDENGDLLFFTDGITVWNQNQEIMPNGTELSGDFSSTQSALIIKKPGSDNIYYLFTIDNVGGPDGLRYSEVDMTLDGGLGDINENKDILIQNSMSEKLTAVLHQNETDFWVVTQLAGSNIYHSYLVTAAGIDMSPVVSTLGDELVDDTNAGIGYLKASHDGLRMANAKLFNDQVDVFDFDNASGTLSNIQTITVSDPYGIEFSPNNQVLYVSTHDFTDEMGIHQFDLSACSEEDIQASDVYLGESSTGSQSLLLGNDGRIYAAAHIDQYLHVVENPDNLGLSCNFLFQETDLFEGDGAGLSVIGLPNFQNSWEYNHHFLTICQHDTIDLVDYTNSDHSWALETDMASVLSGDSIYYVSPAFTSTYVEFDDVDTTYYTVIVKNIPDVFLGNDTTLCPGETLNLYELDDEGLSFLWQDGSADTSFTVTEAGTYWLEVSNGNCCYSSDTIEVDYTIMDVSVTVDDPTLTANLTADSYQWIDCSHDFMPISGATDQSYTATNNGSYAVVLTLDGCVDTSDCVDIQGVSSIDEIKNEILRYFPNPTKDNITLILNDPTQFSSVRIMTPEGKVASYHHVVSKEMEIELPYAQGMYFLQLIGNDDNVYLYKVIKQ
ncbi:MAG: T9SS type A sorting domain-containing protein [Flavobacteriales bacterium]|nr:T9SS type A sorting domain-containing protein [Flavobacteriales bacterium]